MTRNGAVGRYLYDIKFIDIPELSCFSACRTGHTWQLMIHAEVVLKRDGCEGLCSGFHLNMLFCFNGLMQSVTPTTAFHDATCLLINNLYLTLYHHIFIIFVEHGVGFEQLLQGMHALTLHTIVCHELVFLVYFLLFREILLLLQLREFGCDVGQHKKIFLPGLTC